MNAATPFSPNRASINSVATPSSRLIAIGKYSTPVQFIAISLVIKRYVIND